ncbi:metallophosphoesterase family protein [Pedobacter sp. AW31-3R]|uniref:metallophosphoesterase family protein n=1 Tax=Pedobacter sp. AW31-3R TaxID=3445781 RepID=UPI003F9FDF01
MSLTKLREKPVFKLNQPDDSYKFQPTPAPVGDYPYRLKQDTPLKKNTRKLVFHVAGDTGGIKSPAFQQLIANEMAKQYFQAGTEADQPDFLYHVGDIVYHFGEAGEYQKQFFTPYKNYPQPIYAIAGNHDSDVNPAAATPYHSLDAFMEVFCGREAHVIPFCEDQERKSGMQPHIYWTLQVPMANIIGLHSNVPKFGVITEEQKNWFIEELRHAALEKAEKAIIVCIHHAPYSADVNHGSSLAMIGFMDDCFKEAGVRPDLVLSGHVHNYQRFSKTYEDGSTVPFIVCGGGGFDELHKLADPDDLNYTEESELFDDVVLKRSCVMQHGFLKLEVEKKTEGLTISGSYYAIPHQGLQEGEDAPLYEHFELLLNR